MRRVRNTTDWFKLLNFQHTTSNFRAEARHARTTTMRRARNVTLLRVQHTSFNLFNRGMWFKLSKFRHTTSIILCTPWYKLLNFGTPRNNLCTLVRSAMLIRDICDTAQDANHGTPIWCKTASWHFTLAGQNGHSFQFAGGLGAYYSGLSFSEESVCLSVGGCCTYSRAPCTN